jgi:RNA polymerase sigma factor (sigma-70 family)
MLADMTDETDLELLRQFTRDHSQDAFTELVQRHLDLVHAAALRQVRSPELAQDVAQSVFTDLARDARKLMQTGDDKLVLTAWLYAVTRRTAIDVVRKESRRQAREQIAVQMNELTATPDVDWTHLEPVLDAAMAELDEADRTAVLLRYFQNLSLREVGAALGLGEDAAQKRVSRAVDQLRPGLAKHGLIAGAGGLCLVISANAVQAAPAGLVLKIVTVAIKGAAAKTSIYTLVKGTLKAMAWAKFKLPVDYGAMALLTAGAIIFLIKTSETTQAPIDPIAFFRAALASPPDVDLFESGQRTLRPKEWFAEMAKLGGNESASNNIHYDGAMAFYSGARAGTNFYLRQIKDPKTPDQLTEARFIFGRAGPTVYQLGVNNISYGFGSNTFSAVVESLAGLVRQHLNMGLAGIKPDSVVWNSNQFSAINTGGWKVHGELEISNNLPHILKTTLDRDKSTQLVIEYTYPTPPNSLSGFPSRLVISRPFEEVLKPNLEIVLTKVRLAASQLPVDYFSADQFKTAKIIYTNAYTNSEVWGTIKPLKGNPYFTNVTNVKLVYPKKQDNAK